jgi:hypothetical protein
MGLGHDKTRLGDVLHCLRGPDSASQGYAASDCVTNFATTQPILFHLPGNVLEEIG